MKHVASLSKNTPATASVWPETHPSIMDALKGFVEDPVGTIQLHLNKGE